MISTVAGNHPTMALDFVLSHFAQVSPLIDLSSSSRFVAGLVQGSSDATLIPKFALTPRGILSRKTVAR